MTNALTKWLPIARNGETIYLRLHSTDTQLAEPPRLTIPSAALAVGDLGVAYDLTQAPPLGSTLPARWLTVACDGETFSIPLWRAA